MLKKQGLRAYIKESVAVSMCTAMIVISSWLSIPFAVSFTLQTLAIFTVSALFKFRISFSSVALYILIGLCGLPVFSGFTGGPSALVGPTGGFIIGFLLIPVIIKCFGAKRKLMLAVSMLAALLLCYTVGTIWYTVMYAGITLEGCLSALAVCVLPFIIPDILKIALAVLLWSRLKNTVKLSDLRRK